METRKSNHSSNWTKGPHKDWDEKGDFKQLDDANTENTELVLVEQTASVDLVARGHVDSNQTTGIGQDMLTL